MTLRHCILATLALLLAGCGSTDATQVESAGRAVDPRSTGDALDGTWKVSVAGGTSAVVDLHDAAWSLQTECSQTNGTWQARGGLFLARPAGTGFAIGGPGCAESKGDDRYRRYEGYLDDNGDGPTNVRPQPEPPVWFLEAAGYTAAGDGWRFVDRQGATLATLRPGGILTAPGTEYGWFAYKPDTGELTADRRAELNRTPAAPLPAGLEPADADDLTEQFGFWGTVEDEHDPCDSWVRIFQPGGTWGTSFRGFGWTEGSWVIGEDGLALGNWDHVVKHCAEDPDRVRQSGITFGGWMERLARVGRDGNELVLLDVHGKELARLTHPNPPMPAMAPTTGPRH